MHKKSANTAIETHVVPKLSAPMRLQDYGVGIFSRVPTKSALKKALKKQQITVNNSIASTATFISGGETIRLTMLDDKVISKKKLIFKLKVLFEDDYLAVVRKPAGVLVSGNKFKTIANALSQNLKPSILTTITAPQPVHRLDYATTGVLLVGKTSNSIYALNKLFENKEIKKTYYAVTIGNMKPGRTISTTIDGKASQSDYQILESVPSKRFNILNLVKLEPKTGRRHQLRKHLSSIGNPILGDMMYGKENLILKGKGLYLHAYSLKFIHPFTNEKIYVKAELPKRFTKIFVSNIIE